MSGDLQPVHGGLARRRLALSKGRVDEAVSLQAYRHDKASELVVHKLDNIDYVTTCRIQNGVGLGLVARNAVQQCPEAVFMVSEALTDREQLLKRLYRDLLD